jgi:hypothetical protein
MHFTPPWSALSIVLVIGEWQWGFQVTFQKQGAGYVVQVKLAPNPPVWTTMNKQVPIEQLPKKPDL